VLKAKEMEPYKGGPSGLTGTYIGPGKNATLGKYYFKKGVEVKLHTHRGEQISHLLRGKLRIFVNEKEFIVSEGESYLIPAGLEHRMEALEDTVSVDVWSPAL